jgi:murein L,D-transpeptidase YafK
MAGFTQFKRAGLLALVGAASLALASCSDYGGSLPKHMRPLDEKTRELVDRKGMDQRAPILIRLFKEESTLEVWKQQEATGRYALLKSYDVCAWSGVLGPKIKEGDRQAPEGFYTIRPAQMNPDSSYYLAFNMGYPNDFDRAHGRTGSELMVHGACSSRGCYSMTDENIQEIYTLGRLAFQGGQRDFQVQAFPFRMTPENLARHSDNPNMPFWLMLKEGYDHFEAIGQPPKVDVCDRRYVFNAVPADSGSFIPAAACPPMSMPDPIRIALADKEARDQQRLLEIASKLDRQGKSRGAEALRLALAAPTSTDLAGPMSIAITSAATIPPDPSPAAPRPAAPPAMTASVGAVPAADAGTLAATVPQPRPRPATSPTPAEPALAKADPQATPPGAGGTAFLPVPELRTSAAAPEPAAPAPAAPVPAVPPSGAATLEERMLVETAPADSGVANAYASASEEDDGLTGLVLRLFRQ